MNAIESSAYRFNAIPGIDSITQNSITTAARTPIDINALAASAKVQSPSSTLYQLSNSIGHQQFSDNYALPLANQPQLQQHLLQQQSYAGISLPVYNPTYLVTQSNQLLNQHKQQLFKPAAGFINGVSNLNGPEAQAIYHGHSVASPGQIYSAHQDHINDYSFAPVQTSTSNAINSPSFERFISSDSPKSNTIVQSVEQQPLLSEQEIANLLNFGTLNGHSNPTYLSPEYYQTPSSESPLAATINLDQPTKQQLVNDDIIKQANENVKHKSQRLTTTPSTASSYQYVSTASPISSIGHTERTAFDQHQKKLAEHFNDQNPLRIYVPDDDFNSNVCTKKLLTYYFTILYYYYICI